MNVLKLRYRAKCRVKGGHPAKRTFQAIRIELNAELDVLEHSIDRMIDRLKPGGRLSIITFHSLEDRIVKNRFRINENPCTCPPEFQSVFVENGQRKSYYTNNNRFCQAKGNLHTIVVQKVQNCEFLSVVKAVLIIYFDQFLAVIEHQRIKTDYVFK